MPRITAIELENFQSIERRTRIDLKPITLLFGPNSAGKSTIFDALELLRVLLDPNEFNENRATDMVNRWARRNASDEKSRELFLAVEFPFENKDISEIWLDKSNWLGSYPQTNQAEFHFCEYDDEFNEIAPDFIGKTIRIELLLKVETGSEGVTCRLSECRCSLMGRPLLSITKADPRSADSKEVVYFDGDVDYGERILVIYDYLNFISPGLISELLLLNPEESKFILQKEGSNYAVACGVVIRSLSPLNISVGPGMYRSYWKGIPQNIRQNACDIIFYLGTVLFKPLRGQPDTVKSDRRTPNPKEALTVVDLGLSGWWSRDIFSPSSPAALLSAVSAGIDEHFRGLAEVAHADLVLKAAGDVFWGGDHAAKYLEPLRDRSKVLERVNHHLEKNLFTEKLYKLKCASTSMVPIDLNEDDPQGYYILAQPAAVRLFLQDGRGHKVELQDVGSGIPFVLPILFAVACGKLVRIQQPELHLHPALQSSIADIFVEELNQNTSAQFIIETHSEHLLLRLLRRIRDLEKGQCISNDLKLTNDQVAVYYFDPQVNQGTIVTRQMVTPLGDFYTDWPRGFFAERNNDLFDR
jgi:predicted ATPase